MKSITVFFIAFFLLLKSVLAVTVQPEDTTRINYIYQNSIRYMETYGYVFFPRDATEDDVSVFRKYWGQYLPTGFDFGLRAGNSAAPKTVYSSKAHIFCVNKVTNKEAEPENGFSPCWQALSHYWNDESNAITNTENQALTDGRNQFRKFMATVKLDTVSKVLNYSECIVDSGCEKSSWYPIDASQCIYGRAEVSFNGAFNKVSRKLNLNSIDPKSLWIGVIPNRKFGEIIVKTDSGVLMDMPITTVSGSRPIVDRIGNGWSVIYSNYCKGNRREF
jgi:hypothetical protein